MSAPILQRGDAIHLALPITSGLYGSDLRDEANRSSAEQVAFYATMGVTVAQTTWSTGLSAPVIVAVFRQPSAVSDDHA